MWFFSILEQMNNLFTKLLQTAWVVEQSLVPISETWHIVLKKGKGDTFSKQRSSITSSLCSTATKLVNFDTTENSLLMEMM